MGKKIFAMFVCSIALMMFVSTLNGQGSKKTLTLPNGEVVVDLNGEWDVIVENYGLLGKFGTYPQVFKITQEGSSFTGIRMRDNAPPSPGRAGSKCVQGELDKSGFKIIEVILGSGQIVPSEGKISEDGNKIYIHAVERARQTWTRK